MSIPEEKELFVFTAFQRRQELPNLSLKPVIRALGTEGQSGLRMFQEAQGHVLGQSCPPSLLWPSTVLGNIGKT